MWSEHRQGDLGVMHWVVMGVLLLLLWVVSVWRSVVKRMSAAGR
jgi:hypothetical protein